MKEDTYPIVYESLSWFVLQKYMSCISNYVYANLIISPWWILLPLSP